MSLDFTADMLIGFELPSYTVAEDDGYVRVCVLFDSVPAGGYEGTVGVSIISMNGTNAGVSYSGTSNEAHLPNSMSLQIMGETLCLIQVHN